MKTAISQDWKEYFSSLSLRAFLPLSPHTYDLCVTVYKGQTAKVVYKFLGEDRLLLPNKFLKWRAELGAGYQECLSEYMTRYRDIYKVTNVPKYRSFQYRLLQRALVTNIQLAKWNIVETELCTFCKLHIETSVHLLIDCHISQEIWSKVIEYIRKRWPNSSLMCDTMSMIMNRIVADSGAGHVANFICLMTKQYLYACRCVKKCVSWEELQSKFISVERIEKFIALKNNQLSVHARKWGVGVV